MGQKHLLACKCKRKYVGLSKDKKRLEITINSSSFCHKTGNSLKCVTAIPCVYSLLRILSTLCHSYQKAG